MGLTYGIGLRMRRWNSRWHDMSDELKILPAYAEKPFWKAAGLITSSWIARMPR